jgi:hypothetical protein
LLTPDPPASVADNVTVTGVVLNQLEHGVLLQVIVVVGRVVSGPGGGGGVPVITSPAVRTTVPFALRGCNQSRKAVKTVGFNEFEPAQLLEQIPWNTSTTQPPLWLSAFVT